MKQWLSLETRSNQVNTLLFLLGYVNAKLAGYQYYYAVEPFRSEVYFNYLESTKQVLRNSGISCFFTYQFAYFNITLELGLLNLIDYLETALLIEEMKVGNQ